jgi:hypothetical protein
LDIFLGVLAIGKHPKNSIGTRVYVILQGRLKRKECRIVEKLKALNQELQSEWFYFKDGFMDYWKGF